MYPTTEAESLLKNEPEKVRFFKTLDCDKAWQAVKAFSAYEFDCADDSFLWETGIYDFTGKPRYHWSIVRQFTHEEDGKYAYMEQLHFTVYFEPALSLEALRDTVWTYDFENDRPAFFRHVEKLDSFRIPVRDFRPLSYSMDFEEV